MHFGGMNVILLHSEQQHVFFGQSCGHLQGGKSKNTNICLVCWDNSTFKNHIVFVKIPVKW